MERSHHLAFRQSNSVLGSIHPSTPRSRIAFTCRSSLSSTGAGQLSSSKTPLAGPSLIVKAEISSRDSAFKKWCGGSTSITYRHINCMPHFPHGQTPRVVWLSALLHSARKQRRPASPELRRLLKPLLRTARVSRLHQPCAIRTSAGI